MKVAVLGLWHLGCVTAACLAEAGHHVVGLDPDPERVADLTQGRPPLQEPGLPELLAAGLASGRLSFSADARQALRDADVLWVAFDTPVDERDEADVESVRRWLEDAGPAVRSGTLVLVSSQVPVGFTRALARDWAGRGLVFACSPENLRLGQALESFRRPDRVVVGVVDEGARAVVERLLAPFAFPIEWMGAESAEMTKHALNAFLATSATFANEVARLGQVLGADAREVERGLKSDRRIGPRAYLAPGPPFAGGTLARDVRYLTGFGDRHQIGTPLLEGVLRSNLDHGQWLRDQITALLEAHEPVAAVLGLTYKPGTSTLRRSAALELIRDLLVAGARVQAHDPAVRALPGELAESVRLCETAQEALRGADVAVIATAWPEYAELRPEELVALMRRARVVDPGRTLEAGLAGDARVVYVATGRPRRAHG